MLELLNLVETSVGSIRIDFESWFRAIPAAAAWNIVSDYCLDDANKQNDAFSFAIVLNHDTLANISQYIAAIAPKDLKSTRTPSAGLISYLTCPVTFSLSFVVERESRFLRDYIVEDQIPQFLADARQIIGAWATNVPANAVYFAAVDRRLAQMEQELSRKARPQKLIRQILMSAVFGASALMLIHRGKAPVAIRWISDRDAIFDKYDGLAFDLAFYLFTLLRSKGDSPPDFGRPLLTFGLPGMDGKASYEELIRLPDFLAGTLADIKLPQMMFTHRKFPPIFNRVFVDSPNNAVVEVLGGAERITTRRIGFEGAQRRSP
jgi:hypothetical protein